jgi:hypothetical protein
MQNPYEIDIQQEIPKPYLEDEISYKLPEHMNKRCKITENSYQSISYPKRKIPLKRKLDDMSEEILCTIVYSKLKITK